MAIPIRRSKHGKRGRTPTQTLKCDIEVHVLRGIVHRSLQVIRAGGIVDASHPVGRPEGVRGIGGQGRSEEVVAEELQHLVGCAQDGLARVGRETDQVGRPLVAVEVLKDRSVGYAPHPVSIALASQGEYRLCDATNPVGPRAGFMLVAGVVDHDRVCMMGGKAYFFGLLQLVISLA